MISGPGASVVSEWDELLAVLAGTPRENGSASLRETALFVADRLRDSGVEPDLHTFTAYPHEVAALGVVVFLVCAAYAGLLRGRRHGAALVLALVALSAPGLSGGRVPLPGIAGGVVERNVVARLPARSPEQRLILAAHYDTKTELVDHIVRTPVQIAGALLGIAAVVLPLAGLRGRPARREAARHRANVLGITVLAYGVLFLVLFSGGSLVRERSRGALDDGASCAVLLRLVSALAEDPPPRATEIVVVLFAAEEVGAQGSRSFVREYLPALPALPTRAVNLEFAGASRALTILGSDGLPFRLLRSDDRLASFVDSVHRDLAGRPIARTWGGGLTDAYPFLARGIPALTILAAVPPFLVPRGMHTARDERSRVDQAALDFTLRFLRAMVRAADGEGLPSPAVSARRAGESGRACAALTRIEGRPSPSGPVVLGRASPRPPFLLGSAPTGTSSRRRARGRGCSPSRG